MVAIQYLAQLHPTAVVVLEVLIPARLEGREALEVVVALMALPDMLVGLETLQQHLHPKEIMEEMAGRMLQLEELAVEAEALVKMPPMLRQLARELEEKAATVLPQL
jgi:hypothetical protein